MFSAGNLRAMLLKKSIVSLERIHNEENDTIYRITLHSSLFHGHGIR